MRIAILGAGSIGCFVGGAWQAAAQNVRFIGRSRIIDDLAANGLALTDCDGWDVKFAPANLDLATDPAALAEADLIALAVKSGATDNAAGQILTHARPGAVVLSLQNGISNIHRLERVLSDRHEVVRGMVPYNVAYLGGGHFHKGVEGKLYAGDTPATRSLSEAVGASPAGLTLSDDMLAIAWGKLIYNLNNAVNALSGLTLVEQLSVRDYRRVMAGTMREALELLRVAGIEPARIGPIPPALLPMVFESADWLFNNLFLRLQKIDAKARSSMADDFALGRKTEVDFLNGEVIALAERLGTDAPCNRKIVALVRDVENGGPRDWSGTDLRHAVLG